MIKIGGAGKLYRRSTREGRLKLTLGGTLRLVFGRDRIWKIDPRGKYFPKNF